MWALLVAALAVVGGTSSGPPDAAADGRLAINPNISVGDCPGGAAIDVAPTMGDRTLTGTLAGEQPGDALFESYCVGYYRPNAQFCVAVPSPGGYYTFTVTDAGGVDATMGLSGGAYEVPACDDDSAGNLLPKLVQWLEPGEYRLWVGSFSEGASARFTMTVRSGDHW